MAPDSAMIVIRNGLPASGWRALHPPRWVSSRLLGSPVPLVVRIGVERDAAQAAASWGPDENQPAPGDQGAVGVVRGLFPLVSRIQLFQVKSRFFRCTVHNVVLSEREDILMHRRAKAVFRRGPAVSPSVAARRFAALFEWRGSEFGKLVIVSPKCAVSLACVFPAVRSPPPELHNPGRTFLTWKVAWRPVG